MSVFQNLSVELSHDNRREEGFISISCFHMIMLLATEPLEPPVKDTFMNAASVIALFNGLALQYDTIHVLTPEYKPN